MNSMVDKLDVYGVLLHFSSTWLIKDGAEPSILEYFSESVILFISEQIA